MQIFITTKNATDTKYFIYGVIMLNVQHGTTSSDMNLSQANQGIRFNEADCDDIQLCGASSCPGF